MTDQPARYHRTPADIEAVQWTGTNTGALRAFAGSDFDTIDPEDRIEDPDQDAQLLVEASHWVGIKPGDWVVKYEGYFVAKADATFRAVWEPAASPVPPPADQTALRDRIAAALYERERPPRDPAWADAYAMDREVFEAMADAVLAALPEPIDRTAVLLEAAGLIEAEQAREEATEWAQYGELDHETEVGGGYVRETAALLRRMAAEEQAAETQDSLPAWLYQRFMPDGVGWESLDADDRSYWDHQARAVRRAVTRGGFKAAIAQPAVGEQPETQETPVLPCNWAHTRTDHTPHRWEPQPGMDPVHCPGYSRTPE